MRRFKLPLFATCWFVAYVNAYGPIPQPRPQVMPQIDYSPWTPIRAPKYYYGPPAQPAYGVPLPSTPKPYQRPANVVAQVPQMQMPPASPWMPIASQQAPEAPVEQEVAVVFQMPHEYPEPAEPSSSGRLPVPLIFRGPSPESPAVEPKAPPPGVWGAPPSGGWEAPAPDVWEAPAPQEIASAQPLEPSPVPDGPLAPPSTLWALSGDPNAPLRAPQQPASQGDNSLDSWPDTPKDVPGADQIRPLGPSEFGQFAVPPAG